MINVVYNRTYHSLKMDGHAQSGEAGHDLVCSAASILAYTYAAAVANAEAAGQASEVSCVFDTGKAEISCRPAARLEKLQRAILDAICGGFELLARKYPQNISYEIHG